MTESPSLRSRDGLSRQDLAATALVLAAAAAALGFRLPRLGERPMHTDEAVQAVKAGELAATGVYVYDPSDFHGPTLPYLSQPLLWLFAGGELSRASEVTFRLLPALFGTALVLLVLLVLDALSRPGAVAAAWLTAVSPAAVFYSRYYIHETLLVFFTFLSIAAGWRYLRSRSTAWAILAASAAALCQATKETCVIAFAAAAGALALVRWGPLAARKGEAAYPGWPPSRRTLACCAGAALAIWLLLFSGFMTNMRGLLDSALAYLSYLGRSGGAELHAHPWHYYLGMLLFTRHGRGPAWSEAFILALAGAGAVSAFRGDRGPDASGRRSGEFARFLALFAAFMFTAYAAIPYKTPWCVLGPLHAAILLAGIGASGALEAAAGLGARIRWRGALACAATVAFLAGGSAHLAVQAYRASFVFSSDRRNPYVYAHTIPDLVRLASRVEELASLHPEGRRMLVKVIAPDPWPLPWYLRRLENVGYWPGPDGALLPPEAPVLVASPDYGALLDGRLGGRYHLEYYGQRPEVVLALYVEATLWERFLRSRAGAVSPACRHD